MTQARASRQLQKSESRRRLVASARAACEREGFVALKTAEVARAAQLSHGAVFVHFPTREDLLAEVASSVAQELTDELHSRAEADSSLRRALQAHVEVIGRHEQLYRHFLAEAPLLPPQPRASWIGIQSAVSFHIAAAAEREMANGRIRTVPPHLLFNTWVGLVHHYVINRDLFAPEGSVMASCGAELVEHYMSLLLNHPGKDDANE